MNSKVILAFGIFLIISNGEFDSSSITKTFLFVRVFVQWVFIYFDWNENIFSWYLTVHSYKTENEIGPYTSYQQLTTMFLRDAEMAWQKKCKRISGDGAYDQFVEVRKEMSNWMNITELQREISRDNRFYISDIKPIITMWDSHQVISNIWKYALGKDNMQMMISI